MKPLLTSLFTLFVSFAAFCQSETVVINEFFENTPINQVFATLKNKYQLKVAYDYESVKDIFVTKNIQQQDLETALTVLLENTNLEYRLTADNRILVKKNQFASPSSLAHSFTFKGKITDQKSKLPLAYATVYCPATNQGCSTDEDGYFTLSIKTTQLEGTISIQYLGYISRVISWKEGDNLANLNITLQAKSLDFEEVTILEKVPMVSMNNQEGAMVFNVTQLNTLPSFVGGKDIFRSVQLMPGIAASDDLSSELKIRGSSGDENMIILDGITLYKVDHYFGIFSAINSNIINHVKVFKNAFPVEYGGRTAGVVDLTSHHPVEKPKINGGLQLDLLTSSAYLSVPLTDRMGLLVGGRTTNKNVANTNLFELLQSNKEAPDIKEINPTNNSSIQGSLLQEKPNFKFYDINAKWIWQLAPKTTVVANLFKSYDQFDYFYERSFDTRNDRPNGNKDEVLNIENFNEAAEWDNEGVSFQLMQQWNNKVKTDINVSYSNLVDDQVVHSGLVRQITRNPPPGAPFGNEIKRIDTTFSISNSAYNTIQGRELNLKNQWTINEKQSLTFGYHLVNNHVQFKLNVDTRNTIFNDATGTQHAGYLQYNFRQKNRLTIGVGLRNTYYTATQKIYFSPRINATYQVKDNLSLKAAFSQYHQFLRKNYREDRFGRSYDFWVLGGGKMNASPVASSQQLMLGLNFIKSGFVLDVEAYYKNMDGVTEYVPAKNGFLVGMINPSNDNFVFFNGTGVSKGIDILLKKDIQNYSSWLAYTLSKSVQKFPDIFNGQAYPTQDDRRHQLKWVHQYQYKKIDFAATFVYSSGRPYTDLTKIGEGKDRVEIRPSDRISYLKDYQRFDLSAHYRFDIGTSKASAGFSIFNVFNRKNVKYRQFIYTIPNKGKDGGSINVVTGTESLLLGFTPNLNFSLSF